MPGNEILRADAGRMWVDLAPGVLYPSREKGVRLFQFWDDLDCPVDYVINLMI
jgi:hypothetical protein